MLRRENLLILKEQESISCRAHLDQDNLTSLAVDCKDLADKVDQLRAIKQER